MSQTAKIVLTVVITATVTGIAVSAWQKSIFEQKLQQITSEKQVKQEEGSQRKEGLKTYNINGNCHINSKNVICTAETYECTADIQPGDLCGQFVTCSESGEVQKETLFDTCIDCFAELGYTDYPSQTCIETFGDFPEFKAYFNERWSDDSSGLKNTIN